MHEAGQRKQSNCALTLLGSSRFQVLVDCRLPNGASEGCTDQLQAN